MDNPAASKLTLNETPERSGSLSGILWIVGLYAVFAALWISVSDAILSALVDDPVLLATLGTMKGWAFVAVTSLLLFVLLLRFARRQSQTGWVEPPGRAAEAPSEVRRRRDSRNLVVTVSTLAVCILLSGVG